MRIVHVHPLLTTTVNICIYSKLTRVVVAQRYFCYDILSHILAYKSPADGRGWLISLRDQCRSRGRDHCIIIYNNISSHICLQLCISLASSWPYYQQSMDQAGPYQSSQQQYQGDAHYQPSSCSASSCPLHCPSAFCVWRERGRER